MERKVVIPGEMIVEGDDYLPGESTEKRDGKIYALRYGLAQEQNNLIKVIPLSGKYTPRRGNVIIGKVENVIANGWLIDIGAADTAFLSLMEVPKFVNKDAMEEVYAIGDLVITKIYSINKKGIDLTAKGRGFGKVEEGIVFAVNANKVPRIIGKEGSMIKLIKENTGCDITVGQNGEVLVCGDSIDAEVFARKAIEYIEANSYVSGLTDMVTKWFEENK
jgi:exosome complex component RRP4